MIAGFIAGYGVHSAITASPLFGAVVDWQATAKAKGWIPNSACPALPVVLDISSPGSNATIENEYGVLHTDVIVRSSRPLPEAESVGIVFAEENCDYYVIFPNFDINATRTVFREDRMTISPIRADSHGSLNIWAFAIDDKTQIGSHYGTLEEINAISPNLFLSHSVTIYVRTKK